MTAQWFTQHEDGGFPIARAALGSCDLSVLHVAANGDGWFDKLAATSRKGPSTAVGRPGELMRRRDLIITASGQQPGMPVVGVLTNGSAATRGPFVAAFRQGLAETGYIEGKNACSISAGRAMITTDCPS